MKHESNLMGSLAIVGIMTILMGAVVMFMGNRSRGQMSGEYGRSRGTFRGPVWFLLMVIGVFILVLDYYIPF